MMQVAIDGPAGAGKTTVGETLARRFCFLFVESGGLYRGLAHAQLRGLSPESVRLEEAEGGIRAELVVDGEREVPQLGSEEVGERASQLARKEEVRDLVTEKLRRFCSLRDVVVEGRDIGTVVLPQAEVKIFLTASARERARRRKEQLPELADEPLEEIERAIERRDERDRNRDIAPLKPAEGAVKIDSTDLTLGETVALGAALIEDELRRQGK